MIWVAGSRILRLCCPILGLCWSILGLCWPTLVLCWPVLGPRLADHKAYVDPCWAKRSEKWEQQKNTVKRRICWWSAAHLGAMLAHLGGYVAPSWGYVGPSWSYVGPSWGYASPSWGLCWPILRLCWPILRPMLAHVDPSWATCAMLVQKHVESHRAKQHCKLQGFLSTRAPYRRSAAGAQLCWPICWPMLTYLASNVGPACSYVDPAWGYVGLSWRLCGPILRPMSADLEAYVGPCWPAWSQKIRKMGTAKKHCKTQDILRVGGWSWGYVGPSWGYVGPSWSYVGPSWGLCWPILELCWPILGLCWPILGLCWPILRPMLAHLEAYLGPCWPILNHKSRKMGKNAKSTKHRKTREFLAAGLVGGWGGGPSLLRRGENCRTAMPRPGGPWPD